MKLLNIFLHNEGNENYVESRACVVVTYLSQIEKDCIWNCYIRNKNIFWECLLLAISEIVFILILPLENAEDQDV